jgi:hypothetical protein
MVTMRGASGGARASVVPSRYLVGGACGLLNPAFHVTVCAHDAGTAEGTPAECAPNEQIAQCCGASLSGESEKCETVCATARNCVRRIRIARGTKPARRLHVADFDLLGGDRVGPDFAISSLIATLTLALRVECTT